MSLNITSITVTYNPNIESLRRQIENIRNKCNIIVVDNGSSYPILTSLESVISPLERVSLIALKRNTGIAYAQNLGIESTTELFPTTQYFLFLDQDSYPHPTMVGKLHKFLKHAPSNPYVAAGPAIIDKFTNTMIGFHKISRCRWTRIYPEISEKNTPIEVSSINSSGMMAHKDVFNTTGKFDESLFIDHVDTEWSFRAFALGIELYGVPDAKMHHEMGTRSIKLWFFGNRQMPYREPHRHYYVFRNSVLLQYRSFVPKTWKFWNGLKLILTLLYFSLFSDQRLAQVKQMFRGLKDGFESIGTRTL